MFATGIRRPRISKPEPPCKLCERVDAFSRHEPGKREKERRMWGTATCHRARKYLYKMNRNYSPDSVLPPNGAVKTASPVIWPRAIYLARPGQLCGERRRICDSARGTRSRLQFCRRVCSRNGLVKGNLAILSAVGPPNSGGRKKITRARCARKKKDGGEVTSTHVSA